MRFPSFNAAVRAAIVIAAVAVAAACTHPSGTSSRAPRRDPSIMDSTELRDGNYSTVHDAISATRADWLLARGGPSGTRRPELGVWIEGTTRSVGVAYLRNLRPIDIRQVRRLTTTESLHTYSWPWGGLVITLR